MAIPTLTANDPAIGSISWSAFNIQYLGTSYPIAAGYTANKFVWWLFNNGAGGPLQAGDTLPNLTEDDLLLFLNKSGTPVNVQTASIIDGSIIASGSILGDAIAANTITGDNILAGSILSAQIGAGEIKSVNIAAGAITANLIAADAINGKTITGAVVQTASSGQRVVVLNNPNVGAGELDFYSGAANEIAHGYLKAYGVDANTWELQLMGGATDNLSNPPGITLTYTGGGMTSFPASIDINADLINLNDADNTLSLQNNELTWSGNKFSVMGAGTNGMEIGPQDGSSGAAYIDFHSNTVYADYDTRIISSGGNGNSGGGSMTISANTLTLPSTRITSSGSIIKGLTRGHSKVSGNANGNYTITHGMGVTPVAVIATINTDLGGGAESFHVSTSGYTSTTFACHINDNTGANVTTAVYVDWVAIA